MYLTKVAMQRATMEQNTAKLTLLYAKQLNDLMMQRDATVITTVAVLLLYNGPVGNDPRTVPHKLQRKGSGFTGSI